MVPQAVVEGPQAEQEGAGRAGHRRRVAPGRPEAARQGPESHQIEDGEVREDQVEGAGEGHGLPRLHPGGEPVMILVEGPAVAQALAQGLQQAGVAGIAQPGVGEGIGRQEEDPPLAAPQEGRRAPPWGERSSTSAPGGISGAQRGAQTRTGGPARRPGAGPGAGTRLRSSRVKRRHWSGFRLPRRTSSSGRPSPSSATSSPAFPQVPE